MPFDVVHAHDVSGLVPGAVMALKRGRVLIYDSHEFWSDSNHKEANPAWMTATLTRVERLLARRARATITVSEGIADEMTRVLRIPRPAVIRNVPEAARPVGGSGLRRRLGIPEGATIFIYIGGILPNRGVDVLLRAFVQLDNPIAHLVFLGAEDLPDWIEIPEVTRVQERLHFVPPVHPREVVPLARGADVGVHPMRGTSTNHRLCLPNKLFEYIQSGLAVFTSDVPEMRALVERNGFGRTFRDGDIDSAVAGMSLFISDPQTLATMREAVRNAARHFTWEAESDLLIKVYERVIPDG